MIGTNYDNVIQILLDFFPEIEQEIRSNDFLEDLPYCIFEIIVIPFVRELCESENYQQLSKVGELLEQMATCEDMKVNELLNISILEPIVLVEKDILPVFKKHIGQETQKELEYWQKRYDASI